MTLEALIQDVVVRLTQVSGTAVQTYAEDHITKLLKEGFEMTAGDRWWPGLMQWFSYDLDGITGQPTASLQTDSLIQQFTDIRVLFYADNTDPLPILSSSINPYRLSGTRALYVEPLADALDSNGRLFRVWPLESTGTVRVHAKVTAAGLFTDPAVYVPFDPVALINYACWLYTTNDASNPSASDNFFNVYKARKAQLIEKLNQMPVRLDTRMPYNAQGWQELP